MAIPDVAPFSEFLGVKVLHRSAERTEAQLVVREELCNRRGILHGGAIMAFGDLLGGMTAVRNLAAGDRTATIESKTNFFAAVPKGGTAQRFVCCCIEAARPSFWRPGSVVTTASSLRL
jgi:uncharacterized protein (TIGR00369 family)